MTQSAQGVTPATAGLTEAGSGPRIVLVHSSVAGARQWRALIDALSDRYHLVAPDLYGYGATPPWPGDRTQSLEDQARLLEPLLPADDRTSLIGHSFGGSVAMKAAQLFPGRIDRLILIEPNPFNLLRLAGRSRAFAEAAGLCDTIKQAGRTGDWAHAAQVFATYWTGPGSWDAMPPDRRAKFAQALPPNFHEWDCVMNDATPLSDWEAALPARTTVITADDTVRPIAEIAALMQVACPHWRFENLPRGGHMAALTQPQSLLPLIEKALA